MTGAALLLRSVDEAMPVAGNATVGFGPWLRTGSGPRRVEASREPFRPAEVKALLHYVSERGLDPKAAITRPLYTALGRYEAAQRQGDAAEALDGGAEVMALYGQLAALTAPRGVSGWTILCSRSNRATYTTVLFWCVVNLALAVATELPGFAAKLPAEWTGPWRAYVEQAASVGIVAYIAPFFWGGLGSSVYLMKSIAEKVCEHTFDEHRLRGCTARILLGAIFAALVVNGFTDLRQDWVKATALAFICGMGVKAVYAAFEALIDTLHTRIIGTAGGNRGGLPPTRG